MSRLPYPGDDGDDDGYSDGDHGAYDHGAYDRQYPDDLRECDTDDPTTTSSSGEKRTRGIVTMSSIKRARSKGKTLQLSFNEFGQAIGKESESLSFYIGAAVRSVIPIVLPTKDWRSPKLTPLKERLWDELTNTFRGLDQSKKKQILSQAGVMAKNFRAWLRSSTRDPETGLYSASPPPAYQNSPMVAPYWEDFVSRAMEEDFQNRSNRNREQAKSMEARYRGGLKGYARIRENMKEERRKAGESEPVVTRFDLFQTTRKGRDGNIHDPSAQRIIEEAERLSQTMTPDDIRIIGPDDLFGRAIGLQEHPGRLRSVGFGVTKTSLAMAPGLQAMNMVGVLTEQVAKLAKDVERLRSERRTSHGMSSSGASCEHSAANVMFSADPRDDFIEALQNVSQPPTFCYLYLEDPDRLVATGTLHSSHGMIHGQPITPGFVRVTLDVPAAGQEDSAVPKPIDEAVTVGTAVGHFIEWPSNLVSSTMRNLPTPQMPQKKSPQKAKEKSRGVVDSQRGRTRDSTARRFGYPMTGDLDHDDYLQSRVHRMVSSNAFEIVTVPMFAHFHQNTFQEFVSEEHVREVLNDEWLSATTIAIYLRYLGEVYLSRDVRASGMYSFVSPQVSCILGDRTQSMNGLVNHMLNQTGSDHLILWPTNVGNHWVLVAIHMNTLSVYFMDPAQDGVYSNRPDLVVYMEGLMSMYRSRLQSQGSRSKLNKVNWINIKVPRQRDNDHCGHFVCCFIEDIICTSLTNIPPNFVYDRELKSYSKKRLEKWKNDWTGYLYNRFLYSYDIE